MPADVQTREPNVSLLIVLARAFLAGEQSVEQIVARAAQTLGNDWPWLRPIAQRYLKAYAGRTRPRHRQVVQFLLHDRLLRLAWLKYSRQLSIKQWLTEPQQMQPVAAAGTWAVPAIETGGELAEWLLLTPGQLGWFADLDGLGYRTKMCPQLEHYHYRVLAKRSGSVRLIEIPKPLLKDMQRTILTRILEKIPPHPAVHGFLKGRSIKTFIAPHVRRRVVLRMDLQNFFTSIPGARIQALFRTMGYPESVADSLGGICTNATPRHAWNVPPSDIDPRDLFEVRSLYARPHLPQGAPTSPALANLCAYRVDCRLARLAKSVGAEYTRYADDLAFSGDETFDRRVERFAAHVGSILIEEGFTVNHRKTRIMHQGVRQYLAGLVANRHVNIVRADFDRLKAVLTNCARLGPESQNREAHHAFRSHLEGRVGFVESINPAKGKRLGAIFQRIQWQ